MREKDGAHGPVVICRRASLVLQAISGSDSEDPGSAGKSFVYQPKYLRKPSELTIGYAPVDFEEAADESARADLKAALALVSSAKATKK